jgi:spore germination cell wall hydrolase CwlJ-like protein
MKQYIVIFLMVCIAFTIRMQFLDQSSSVDNNITAEVSKSIATTNDIAVAMDNKKQNENKKLYTHFVKEDPTKNLRVILPSGKLLDLSKDINVLALNILFEAANDDRIGQEKVALVVKNRVNSKLYPDTYRDVILFNKYKPELKGYVCSFSWLCDEDNRSRVKGQKNTFQITAGELAAWKVAKEVAQDVYFGRVKDHTFGATHYFGDYIKPPKWAGELAFISKYNKHSYYHNVHDNSYKKLSYKEYKTALLESKNNGSIRRIVSKGS